MWFFGYLSLRHKKSRAHKPSWKNPFKSAEIRDFTDTQKQQVSNLDTTTYCHDAGMYPSLSEYYLHLLFLFSIVRWQRAGINGLSGSWGVTHWTCEWTRRAGGTENARNWKTGADVLWLQSHKTFRTKQKLARAQKQNRPIPQWIRLRTGNTIRYALFFVQSRSVHITAVIGDSFSAASDDFKENYYWWLLDTTQSEDIGVKPVSVSKQLAHRSSINALSYTLRYSRCVFEYTQCSGWKGLDTGLYEGRECMVWEGWWFFHWGVLILIRVALEC